MAIEKPKTLLEKLGLKKADDSTKKPDKSNKEDNKHFVGMEDRKGQNE